MKLSFLGNNIDVVFNVSLPVGMPKLCSKGPGNNGEEGHVEILVAGWHRERLGL